MFLYLVHTRSICYPDPSWLKEFKAKHVCPACKEIYPDVRKSALDVWLEEPPDVSAVNAVEPPGINIARCDFLNLFSAEVTKYLKLGRIFTGDGTLVEEFVTFVGRRRLPIRGSEKSYFYGICHLCGGFNYLPAYPWYVMRACLFDQPLYESWGEDGLVVTQALRDRVEKG